MYLVFCVWYFEYSQKALKIFLYTAQHEIQNPNYNEIIWKESAQNVDRRIYIVV